MKTSINFPTKFQVGDVVRHTDTVTLIGAFKELTVEAISFDHNHGGPTPADRQHRPECYREERIEYAVVAGGPESRFRANVAGRNLVLVRRANQ